jgi:hypothetical protein
MSKIFPSLFLRTVITFLNRIRNKVSCYYIRYTSRIKTFNEAHILAIVIFSNKIEEDNNVMTPFLKLLHSSENTNMGAAATCVSPLSLGHSSLCGWFSLLQRVVSVSNIWTHLHVYIRTSLYYFLFLESLLPPESRISQIYLPLRIEKSVNIASEERLL